jgi:hypothetical protein
LIWAFGGEVMPVWEHAAVENAGDQDAVRLGAKEDDVADMFEAA